DEVYTHTFVQRIRTSRFVHAWLYPRVLGRIYSGKPYITEDERKLDERQLYQLQRQLRAPRTDYFNAFVRRLFSDRNVRLAKLDRRFLRLLGSAARLLAG